MYAAARVHHPNAVIARLPEPCRLGLLLFNESPGCACALGEFALCTYLFVCACVSVRVGPCVYTEGWLAITL